jgi:hypothetical protein
MQALSTGCGQKQMRQILVFSSGANAMALVNINDDHWYWREDGGWILAARGENRIGYGDAPFPAKASVQVRSPQWECCTVSVVRNPIAACNKRQKFDRL